MSGFYREEPLGEGQPRDWARKFRGGDARNANNQSSAPAWAGLGGRRGAPERSRVHPRAGPGGDTKKPGTPTPTAGARRDPRGAPPAAKFTAPRAPRARRCPRPGEVSRLGAPHPETPVGPRAPRRARETPLGSCPPLPRPPALAGRFRARGPPAAALTDVCPAGRRGPELDPPCSAPPWPHCLDGAPRSLSRSLFRAAKGLRRSRARSALDWRLQTTPRASRPAQSRARRRPEQRTGGGAASPRPPQLSLLPFFLSFLSFLSHFLFSFVLPIFFFNSGNGFLVCLCSAYACTYVLGHSWRLSQAVYMERQALCI